jgi:hypothetical protein
MTGMSSSIFRSRHSFRVSIIDTYRTESFALLGTRHGVGAIGDSLRWP